MYAMLCLTFVTAGCKKNKTTKVYVAVRSDQLIVQTLKIVYTSSNDVIYQGSNSNGTKYEEYLDLKPGQNVKITCSTSGSLSVTVQCSGKKLVDYTSSAPKGSQAFEFVVPDEN